MARRLAFAYTGPRPLSRWDIRWRVFSVGVFSAVVLAAPPWSLVPLAAGLALLLVLAEVTWSEIARLLASLAWFFAFFLGAGFLLTPTTEHLAFLGLQSARFLLLFLASHVLLVTATPLTVTAAIQWFLGFLGAQRAYFAASMAGWALGSVPRVLDQARSLTDAAALRGLTMLRRPLGWTRLVTLGLLVKTIETAALTAQALEVRSFGSQIPPHGLRARPRDAVAGTAWSVYCVVWLVLR